LTPTHAAPPSGNSVTNGSNNPEYQDLKVIRYSGMPSTLPAGVIGLFDAAPTDGSWTQVYTNSRIIRGASSVTTAGSNTHSHTVTLGTSGAGSTTSSKNVTGTGTTIANHAGHTHDGGNNTTDSVSIVPPYRDTMLYKLDSDLSLIPLGLIGLFDAAAPSSWDSISGTSGAYENNFIQGATTYGGTGGASTHGHANVTITTGVPLSTAITGTGTIFTTDTHTHTYDVPVQTDVTHLPVYRDTVIAKYNPDLINISGTTDVTSGTVAVAVDGSLQTGKTAAISGGTFNIMYVDTPAGGANITFFIEGAATADESSAVMTYSGSGSVSGMVLNKHVFSVGATENSSTAAQAVSRGWY